MGEAKRDSNYVPTLLAVSSADDATPVRLQIDPTTKRLLVDVSGGGTSIADDAAFTPGTTEVVPVGGTFDDTTPDSVNEGDAGAFRMSANRNLYIQIRDADGNERGLKVDANGAIAVTGASGGTQYAEDAAHVSGNSGNLALVVRQDTPGNLSGTDGDYEALQVSGGRLWASTVITGDALTALQLIDDIIFTDDAAFTPATSKVAAVGATFDDTTPDSVDEGDIGALRMSARRELYVQLRDAAGNERGLNIAADGSLAITVASIPSHAVTNAGTFVVQVDGDALTALQLIDNIVQVEDAAHSSGQSGVMALAVRQDTPNAAVAGTDGDYIPLATSSTGAIRVAPISEDFAALANGPQVKKYYTSAGAATDGIIWSPAAGKRWYVTDIFINISAAATITLEDDLAAGDSAVWKAELAANSGWSHPFNTPLFSGEDAADLLITTSAGNVYVTVTGYEV